MGTRHIHADVIHAWAEGEEIQMLTQQKANELFEYKEGAIYWKVSLARRIKIGDKAGAPNGRGYLRTQVNGKSYQNHRIIFLMHHGFLPEFIDHIDGNTLNNSIDNLRAATLSQNQHNSKIPKNNSSGVKGVYWHAQKNKWCAALYNSNKRIQLGLFENIEDARDCIEKARNGLHKEFANNGVSLAAYTHIEQGKA